MTAVPLLDRRGDYVSAVAVELADLAPDDRAELIEELDDHIAALLEDRPDADLIAELGTPRAYAAELRTAAGLTGSTPPRPAVRDLVGAVRSRVVVAAPWLPGFLLTLRPAWWVLRGVLVALAAGALTGFWWRSTQGVVLLILGVGASLWVAQRPRPTRAFRTGVIVVDVVAVLALLWVAFWSSPLAGDFSEDSYIQQTCTDVTNLQPYDASGRPLTDVRLVDQNGNPFDLEGLGCGSYDATLDHSRPGTFPYPTLPFDPAFDAPTGPPASLTPLPGATVPSTTPGASGTADPTTTPTASTTPTR